jgi:iron complex outermembrane receptor protein
LQWHLASNQALWSAISRAARTPSRVDRDLVEPAPPHLLVLTGSSDYKSEYVTAYELGYRGAIGAGMTGSISTFYNNYRDVRSTSFTPTTIVPLFFANNVEGHTYGLELSATRQMLEFWSLHAGYNFLKESLRVKPGQFDLSAAHNETADPEQQASIRSSMNLPRRVRFDATLRWVDTLHINNNAVVATVPSYVELDTRVSWRASQRLELSIAGQNLLHNHHPEYGFPSPTREEIERSVYGKITWQD